LLQHIQSNPKYKVQHSEMFLLQKSQVNTIVFSIYNIFL